MLINIPLSPRLIQFFYDELYAVKAARTSLTYTQADIEEFIKLQVVKIDISRVQWYAENASGKRFGSGLGRRSYQQAMIAMQDITKQAWVNVAPLSAEEAKALIVFRNTQFTEGYTESREQAGKQGGLFLLPFECATEIFAGGYGLFLGMSEPQVIRDTANNDLHVIYQNKSKSIGDASSATAKSEVEKGYAYQYSYHFTVKQNSDGEFHAEIDADKYQFQIDDSIFKSTMLPQAHELLRKHGLRNKSFTMYMLPALIDADFTAAFAAQYVEHNREVRAYVKQMIGHAFGESSPDYIRVNKALDDAVVRENIKSGLVIGVLAAFAVLAIIGIAAIAATGFGAVAIGGVVGAFFAAMTTLSGVGQVAAFLTAVGATLGLAAGVGKAEMEIIRSHTKTQHEKKQKVISNTRHINDRLSKGSGVTSQEVSMREVKETHPVETVTKNNEKPVVGESDAVEIKPTVRVFR